MPPAGSFPRLCAGEEGLAFGQFGLAGASGFFFQVPDPVARRGELELRPRPAPGRVFVSAALLPWADVVRGTDLPSPARHGWNRPRGSEGVGGPRREEKGPAGDLGLVSERPRQP